jgi:D-alanine-D-alanine ligase
MPKFIELVGKIAVLFGGTSAEREVSLQSGRAVLDALTNRGYQPVGIDTGSDSWQQMLAAARSEFVFIALHGPGGEDGVMQGYLETIGGTIGDAAGQTRGLRYSGSGVLASALAMDKMRTKQLWKGVGVATAPFAVLTDASNWKQICRELGDVLMVKPALEGSSIGMSKVKGAEQLEEAYRLARQYGDLVIAEAFVSGSEYTVAILGDQVLPPIKLETHHVFYDYNAKYLADDTRYICPCGLSSADEAELKALARRAFDTVGCRGWGRVDVMRDDKGNFFVLEVNTVPGMTSHSLVPMAAKAAGIDFDELVETIVASSIAGNT